MKQNQFFCEIIQKSDPVIKFQMITATKLKDAIDILNKKYTNIKEMIIKDMLTGTRHTNKF